MAPIPILTRRDCDNQHGPLSILIYCLSNGDPSAADTLFTHENTTKTVTHHRLHRRDDRNDGVIIGIVFGVVFFITFICVAMYFHAHTKRSKSAKKKRKNRRRNDIDDDSERGHKKSKKGETKGRRRQDPRNVRWPNTAAGQSWLLDRHPVRRGTGPAFELDIIMPAPVSYPPRLGDWDLVNEMDAPQIIYPDERWRGDGERRGVHFYRDRM